MFLANLIFWLLVPSISQSQSTNKNDDGYEAFHTGAKGQSGQMDSEHLLQVRKHH